MEMIATELVETGAKRDGRGRRLVRREEANAAIAAYERSGLTQKAFAAREGIKFFTFAGWLKRRREEGVGQPAFAQVRIGRAPALAKRAAMSSELVVELPSGVVVRGIDGGAMAELIRRLGC